jgi:hypothetical protein
MEMFCTLLQCKVHLSMFHSSSTSKIWHKVPNMMCIEMVQNSKFHSWKFLHHGRSKSDVLARHEQFFFFLSTTKVSKNKLFWWVFWIEGFEGEIGPPTCGGPHNSTGAPISNHQTSKFRCFGSKSQIFCGCFEFEVLKVELDPKSVGDLIITPGPQLQITKHLNLVVLAQRANFFRGCFEFEVLKVELDPQCMGTS